MCLLRLPDCVKCLLQPSWLQAYGRSPVCVRLCAVRWPDRAAALRFEDAGAGAGVSVGFSVSFALRLSSAGAGASAGAGEGEGEGAGAGTTPLRFDVGTGASFELEALALFDDEAFMALTERSVVSTNIIQYHSVSSVSLCIIQYHQISHYLSSYHHISFSKS